jgi:N-acetylmuramoyl-L-alanine amidase
VKAEYKKKEKRKIISSTEMRRKLGYILTVIILAPFFMCASEAPCSASGESVTLLNEADECRKTLDKSAEKKKYRHNWDTCLRAYKDIYSRYPRSGEAAWALYHSGRLYTELYKYSVRSKDLDEAISIFRKLADGYEDHRLADDGQYLIGKIFYEQKKDTARACEEFTKVEKFPSGDMLPRARKMLAKLSCTVEKHEILSDAPKKPAELLLEDADQCSKELSESAKKKKYRRYWDRCLRAYKEIYSSYPESDQAPWALYRSGGLYVGLYKYSGKSKDLDEAISIYRQLVDGYKDHRLADDAQYRIGDIYKSYKKDYTQAYVEFLKVDIKFPSGDMKQKARKMLDELAVTLSKREDDKTDKSNVALESGLTPVEDIRYWSTPTYTRVVVDLKGPVKYEHHLLKADPDHKKPRRIYLDLKESHVTSQIDTPVAIKDGLLQMARAGQYTKDTVRVVLDIESIEGYKVFHLHDPFRIVVDVRRQGEEGTTEDKTELDMKKRPVRKGIRKSEVPDRTVSLARQLGLNVKRIVIDPGHGGKDPGCFVSGGIKEKDIVLSIAKILSDKIEKKIGCEVMLTRTDDVFIPLERRTAVANMKKADLFISLHINAHRSKKIWGLETYFLNMATDRRAVMVAARENATSEKNISDLQTILNDLMLNTKIHESSRLAHEVQKGMMSYTSKRYSNVKDLGVKQAPFYVLIGAQMPAILVETGFITNATEQKRLVSKGYQEEIAEGIVKGITEYIKSIDRAYTGG